MSSLQFLRRPYSSSMSMIAIHRSADRRPRNLHHRENWTPAR